MSLEDFPFFVSFIIYVINDRLVEVTLKFEHFQL